MAYPFTPTLEFPLKNYKVNSYHFGEHCAYNGENWGIHLGEDVNRPTGTSVKCIGRGKVIYSALHPAKDKRGNWGNIVIVAHKNPKNRKPFFSLYAHLDRRDVVKGERVSVGQPIGVVGKANSVENGMWPEAHLHFGIYCGPWKGRVLPGYHRKGDKRTRLSWWRHPTEFLRQYPS